MVPTEEEAGWAPKLVCMFWRKEKISFPCQDMKLTVHLVSKNTTGYIWMYYIYYLIIFCGAKQTEKMVSTVGSLYSNL